MFLSFLRQVAPPAEQNSNILQYARKRLHLLARTQTVDKTCLNNSLPAMLNFLKHAILMHIYERQPLADAWPLRDY